MGKIYWASKPQRDFYARNAWRHFHPPRNFSLTICHPMMEVGGALWFEWYIALLTWINSNSFLFRLSCTSYGLSAGNRSILSFLWGFSVLWIYGAHSSICHSATIAWSANCHLSPVEVKYRLWFRRELRLA